MAATCCTHLHRFGGGEGAGYTDAKNLSFIPLIVFAFTCIEKMPCAVLLEVTVVACAVLAGVELHCGIALQKRCVQQWLPQHACKEKTINQCNDGIDQCHCKSFMALVVVMPLH